MNRLGVRLVVSHLLVALVGAAATFAVVRSLAPALFDESLRRNPTPGGGRFGGGGQGMNGMLRDQFAAAVDQSLLVGALVGLAAAAILGALLAVRVLHPLGTLRSATRQMARGRYDVRVPTTREVELAALADDVNTLGAALAETEARRTRLLGEVAHELRTPLTVIDGYVEGMIDGVLPATAAELSQVSQEVRRMRRLADDLSALSRAEEGRLAMVPAPADLRDVVQAAVERLRPQAEDAGLTLSLETGSAPIQVIADAERIAQVLTNLVGNAFRATPAGGRVSVICSATSTDAMISVADTGVGLEASDLERVFERFYRVGGRGEAGRDGGSGIGLTIARGIVRAHGGELAAASAGPGRGATFTVRLPLRASG